MQIKKITNVCFVVIILFFLGLAIFVIANPGIPVFYVISSIWNKSSTEKNETIQSFWGTVKEADAGYLTSLSSNKNYFQGLSNTTFYIGKKDCFNGIYLIKNYNNALEKIKISFFLNFKPTTVDLCTDSLIHRTKSFEYDLKNKTGKKLKFKITNIPAGKNEFCIVLDKIMENTTFQFNDTLTYTLKEKDMVSIHIIKQNKNYSVENTKPYKTLPLNKKSGIDSEIYCFFKNNKIAILNATDSNSNGVLFFSSPKKPVFYSIKPNTENIFHFNNEILNTSIYHISNP